MSIKTLKLSDKCETKNIECMCVGLHSTEIFADLTEVVLNN